MSKHTSLTRFFLTLFMAITLSSCSLLKSKDTKSIGKDLLFQQGLAYANNNPEKAEMYLAKAYQIAPEEPRIAAHYASILVKRGKPREAVEVLRSALKANPDNSKLKEELASILKNILLNKYLKQ